MATVVETSKLEQARDYVRNIGWSLADLYDLSLEEHDKRLRQQLAGISTYDAIEAGKELAANVQGLEGILKEMAEGPERELFQQIAQKTRDLEAGGVQLGEVLDKGQETPGQWGRGVSAEGVANRLGHLTPLGQHLSEVMELVRKAVPDWPEE